MNHPVVSNTSSSLNIGGSPYPFKFLCKNPKPEGNLVCDHVYTFQTKHNIKYLVNISEFDIGVYGVKYYLKLHQKHPNRYKLLSNKGDAIIVLKTIVAIMLDILRKDVTASFAFIGMPKESEDLGETRRFKVYRKVSARYFSYSTFDHVYDENKSFYMLLNKKRDTDRLGEQILKIADQVLRDDDLTGPNFSRTTS